MMAIQLEYLSSNLVYVVDNNNPMWSGCSKTRNQVLSFLGREELNLDNGLELGRNGDI